MAENTNPIDQALSGGGNPIDSTIGSAPAALSSVSSSNPIDAALGGEEPRPDNGQPPEPTQHVYQDSSQPWYKRAWDFANTPMTESLFGLPEERQGAGGFERAAEHIASGLTSPLSVALTAATFGGGGLIEGAGVSALKESGLFTAAEIADAAKGSQAAVDAFKASKDIEPAINAALKSGGHDLGLLGRAREAVAPLNRDAELATDEMQSNLSKVGLNNEQRTALSEGKLSGKSLPDGATEEDIAAHEKAETEARNAIAKANGGFTDKELSDLAKTGETVAKAKGEFTPIEDAVRESGADVDNWKKADALLQEKGLTAQDLAGGNALVNGAFQILRHTIPDVPIAASLRMAKTANAVLNAGFTFQQFETAAAMSPRFLDALKEGDTDKAWEYGTEAFTGGALGLLGAPHALHAAGELFHPLIENDAFRPNDHWLAIDRANKEREAQHAVAEQQSIDLDKKVRDTLGRTPARPILGDTPEVKSQKQLELASVMHQVVTGADTTKAAQWHDALQEAVGKDIRISPDNGITAYHGTPAQFDGPPLTDGLGAHFTLNPELAKKFAEGSKGRVIEANLGIRNPLRIEDHGGSHTYSGSTIAALVKQGHLPAEEFDADAIAERQNARQQEMMEESGTIDRNSPLGTPPSEAWKKANIETWGKVNNEELERAKQYLKSKGYDGIVYDNKSEGYGDSYIAFDQNQIGSPRPDNGQTDLRDQIDTNNFKKLPKDYQDTVIESLRRVAKGELSPKEMEAAKILREEQAKNFQIGSTNDILHAYVEDYMRRAYEDENPQGKVVLSDAKQGKFATNVSSARQRVYDSHITALLKSPKKMGLDPISLTAEGRGQLIKAAANKQLIDTLRDKFTRGSDGRPAVVLSGQGQVVSGPNGEDPKTFIDPSRVRKINVADPVIEQLTKSGDLQKYLDDGTLKDITPYIRPNNIGAAIERLDQQAQRTEAKYDPDGNNILRKQISDLTEIQKSKNWGALQDFNGALKKNYAWDPQDYINLSHNAMKGWNFVTNDAAGHQVFVRSDILVHPEFAEYLKNRLGLEQGALSKNPIGKAILGVGTKAKETLLSLSPFHLVQIALRGIMTGINPFTLNGPDIIDGAKVDPSDPNSPTKVRKMVEQGYTTGTDYRGQQGFTEGVAAGDPSLLRKVPVVGPVLANSMKFYSDFLFKKFLPAIKSTAAEKMFDDYRAKYPDWSVDRVAKAAALHSNDNFGGINWVAMGRSATTQEFARALLLAPDWLESELRSGARLFNKDEGAIGRGQVIKMAGAMWLMARVLNKVTTGSYHQEAPFSLATKSKDGKETLWSIRVLPTDLLHAASDPVNFIKGRLSPTVHLGQELLSGRDNYGRKLAPEDLFADAIRQTLPIPVQAVGQALTSTGPEVGNAGQSWKAIGGTAQTYQTPAGKMAADLAASHSEDGLVDPSQQARHRAVMDMEDKVRTGNMSYPDLMKLAYNTDQLKESELKKIQQNLQKTRGMDSTLASLYTRASRLPAKEYLDLYDEMNPTEKTALTPLTIQVQRKYLTKMKKDATPQERQQDPVFQRLLRMVPQPVNQQQ